MATSVQPDPTKPYAASQPPTPAAPAPAAPPLPVAGQTAVSPGQPPTQVASAPPAATAPTPATASAPAALPLASAPPAPTTPPPNGELLNQTITAPKTADRVQLAQDAFKTFAESSDPYYQKSLRDATSQAASAGQLGSGQLRTSLGDAQNLRNQQLDAEKATLLNNATTGSIADQYANTAIAQQQQGFQAAQQQAGKQNDIAGGQLALAQKAQDQGNTLATGQLDLSKQLGTGQLSLAQQQAAQQNELAKGQLDLSKTLGTGQLALAQSGQQQAGEQFGQSLDVQKQQLAAQNALAQAQQDLNRQVQTGQLTIAQANQKLAELQNSQSFDLNSQGLQLAKNAQDIGVDQFGKQFEAGQQSTAFNQAATQAQIEEALRNGDFSRAMQLLQAGNQGNPSDTALTLAQSYGNQAGTAGAAAGNLLGNATRNAGGVSTGQGGGSPTQGQGVDLSGIDLSGLFGAIGGPPPDYANTPGAGPTDGPIPPVRMPPSLTPQFQQLPLAA